MAEQDASNVLGIPSAADEVDNFFKTAPPPPEDLEAGIDDFFKTSGATRTNLKVSRDTNPDEYAKGREAAAKIGVADETAELDAGAVKEAALDKSVDEVLTGNPATDRFFQKIENAKAASDSVEQLGVIERLSRGFQRGRAISQLGYAGLALRGAPTSVDAKARVAELSNQLRALGQDTEGFVSGLAGVTEFFGQRVEAASRPEAAVMTAEGAAIGGAVGLAGGPFAPITSTAGAIAGAASGFAAANILDIGRVEAGNSYVEQIKEGVDPNVAYWTSAGVGVVNAALETVGGASFLRPLTQAGKAAFKQGLKGFVKNPQFIEAARQLAVNYGLNLGVETATEVAQEMVNIAAEELGKELTEGKHAEWTPEKWSERLSAITIKTLKTTAFLAAPGSTRGFVRDVQQARKADANAKQLDTVKKALTESALTDRSPQQAAEHVAETFADQGIFEIFIPVEAINEAAVASGDPAKFYENLGVTDQIELADTFNGDVRISTDKFSQHVLQTDAYAGLRDHIRLDEDSLTVAEGQEQALDDADAAEVGAAAAVAKEDQVSPVPGPGTQEGQTAEQIQEEETVQLAEHEMGFQALFKSAREVGLTDTQYASYLEATQRSKDMGRRRKERKRLKRIQKRAEAKYVKRRESVQAEVVESVSQEPLYQAQLAIGNERLDYNETLDALNGDVASLEALPRNNGMRIYAPKSQEGVSPDLIADIYGLEGGDIMLYRWLDNPGFDEAVQQRTDARMEQESPTLLSNREDVAEALEALHTDDFGEVLAFELNAVREARGQKRLKPSLLKAKARAALEDYKLSEISVGRLEATQKREAGRARKAIRAGDLDAAATAKLNQLVAFQMTKEAYRVKEEVKKGNAFMKRFPSRKKMPSLPVDFRNSINDLLSSYQLGPRLSDRKIGQLEAWANRKADEEGVPVQIPQEILDADGQTNYQDMTLHDWRELYNTVRSMHKEGVTENKFRIATEKATVQGVVDNITVNLEQNLKKKAPRKAEGVTELTDVSAMSTLFANAADAKDNFSVDVSTLLLNTDSLLRNMDGFVSLGPAYTYIKGGIDRALTEGYTADQVGVVARMKQESAKLVDLFDMYSKTERNLMGRERDIPGVRTRLSRAEQMGVLLNMGNSDNIQAMVESKQFTEEELQAILNTADKRDLDFAQGVWDFFETFAPEIKSTVKRRQNRIPVMVEALAFDTQHGQYRGGYFPLKYDSSTAVLEGQKNATEAIDAMLGGVFSSSHTRDGHTQTRKGSGGRPVKLDPFVINSHVQQLVYDLEMGDAVYDSYKVLHHKDTKEAFSDAGQVKVWDALDIWLGDVITGEMHHSNYAERVSRHIRTGTTVSALALNFSVAMLQPLGLLQSAVQIGKKNTVLGTYDLLRNNPLKMYKWVSDQSGFMAERERSFNKDIHDAQKGLTTGFLSKITPGRTAEHMADTMFLPIAKAQRVVDMITWLGAKRQGLEMFPGDDAKSTLHADRMVARTQGSGSFSERTSIERGTISKSVRNSETVRVWSLFLNYFAAKLNVAYERTKTTNFKSPFEVVDYASDMVMLFMIEGFLASVIKEGWPDDEEDENAFAKRMGKETVKTFVAGIPGVREAISSAEGFDTGGALGSFAGKVARAGKQISQAETDAALLKSINSVLGTIFKYPTSQVHKTGQAMYDASEEEDVDMIDYIMGRRFSK